NLRGVELDEVRRGDALVTPGQYAVTSVIDVRLSGDVAGQLPGAPMLHVGSAAVAVRARPLGAATARPALRRRGSAAARAGQLESMSATPDPAAEVARRGAVPVRRLVEIGAVEAGALGPGVPPPDGVLVAGEWAVAPARWRQWQAELLAAVDRRAVSEPLSPGLPRAAAGHALDLPDVRLLDALVAATPEVV